MKTDYFNPSPNVEDRRDELDPIKRLLLDVGATELAPEDIAKFTGPIYNAQDYIRDNPTNTPLGQSDLAEQAGAVDLQIQKMQQERARREAIDERMKRYKDLLSGKSINK